MSFQRTFSFLFCLIIVIASMRISNGGFQIVNAKAQDIPIGAIYSNLPGYTDAFTAMKFALESQRNQSKNDFKFLLTMAKIDTIDAYKLSRIICTQFQRGIFALMGTVDPESFDTLHSYANAFEMPFVTPWFPESMYSSSPKDWKQEFAFQIRPEYNQGLIDIISYYGWRNIIYIYSDFDGFLRLQRIHKNIPKNVFPDGGPFQFRIDAVKQISSASEAIDFLLELEKSDRNAVKYVVLDCPPNMAKDIVLSHVRNVYLGRRNFHYLMSGLVLDDVWVPDVAEYYAVNITGLRLVSPEKRKVKKILNEWKKLDKKNYKLEGMTGISASGALAYDAFQVLDSAFRKILKEKPFLFSNDNDIGPIRCDMTSEGKVQPWKHGATIARALKNVKMDGLTGSISFNNDGKRTNYSFDVVELSPENGMSKIGTWSDRHRLRITNERNGPFINTLPPRGYNPSGARNTQNRTYIMTTILQRPYLMRKRSYQNDDMDDYYDDDEDIVSNDQYEGYCKDLADELSRETRAAFVIRPVKDGRYGAPNPDSQGGWDGMIGELVRREAEIAVAPLTITAEREKVVDFSKVYMSAGVSIMVKKPSGRFGGEYSGFFSFISPLSTEVWTCILGCIVGVSIVIFIVSRFSPTEWSIEDSYSLVGGSGATVRNKFSVSNSIWFVIASALGQSNADVTPRSPSGRVVGAAWWFFVLILVASYTANLTAYLTIERMASSAQTADELSRQTDIEYGTVIGGATFDFFSKSKIATYQRMHEYMASRGDEVLVNSTEDGVNRVRSGRGGYAFILDSPTNEFENQQYPCNTIKGGKNLNGGASGGGFGIATSKGSGLREPINMAVLRLRESGKLNQLKNKWWNLNAQCANVVEDGPTISYQSELSLSDLSGIFFILVLGLIVGMIMAIIEFCHKSNVESKTGKVNFSDAMRNKAKLALQGGTDSSDVDAVRFYGDSSAL